jgi:hypothetical protein
MVLGASAAGGGAEYVTAWLLIHALAAIEGQDPPVAGPGTIFAMSVGYDYAGITGPAVDHFIDVMAGRELPRWRRGRSRGRWTHFVRTPEPERGGGRRPGGHRRGGRRPVCGGSG